MRRRSFTTILASILLTLSAGLYTSSLFMTVFSIERNFKILGMGRVEQESYRLFGAIESLWNEGQPGLAIIITAFSFVFPVAKYLALAFILFAREETWRNRVLTGVKNLGQWSMGDVFVVALMVVIVRVDNGIAQIGVQPHPGLWIFASSVILAMIVSAMLSYERPVGRVVDARSEPGPAGTVAHGPRA